MHAVAAWPGLVAEAEPPVEITPESFEALFPEIAGQRFDLVLVWDMINLLPARALPAFFAFISRHANDTVRRHGFMLHTMLDVGSRAFRPLVVNNNPSAGLRQWLWTDAVYVRDVASVDEGERE